MVSSVRLFFKSKSIQKKAVQQVAQKNLSKTKGLKHLEEDILEYIPTNRTIDKLLKETNYPKKFFNQQELKDKTILDVGTGGGNVVLEVQKMGADALGIDIEHHQNFKKYPHLLMQMDARKTNFQKEEFDMIYSSWAMFTFGAQPDMQKTLQEFKRILKPDGKIRLGAITFKQVNKAVKKVGGLKITDRKDQPVLVKLLGVSAKADWVEITKISK